MAAEMAPTDARPYLSLGRLAARRSQPAGDIYIYKNIYISIYVYSFLFLFPYGGRDGSRRYSTIPLSRLFGRTPIAARRCRNIYIYIYYIYMYIYKYINIFTGG